MNKIISGKNGFTLVELIAVLVVLGVLGTLTILSMTNLVQAFVFTKKNAVTAQKVHIALDRLTKEFTNITVIISGADDFITFNSYSYLDGSFGTITVSLDSDELKLDDDTLIDNVNLFELKYLDTFNGDEVAATESKVIEMKLGLTGANDSVSVFTTRAIPRFLGEIF